MSPVHVGGIRSRLIRDSLITMVTDSLGALGWFAANRQHAPLNVVSDAVPDDEDVPFNTLAFADDDVSSEDIELGSNLAEHSWTWYIDFFAEDNSLGLHVIQDVKAILQGRFPSVGRTGPFLRVYDYSLISETTPVAPLIFVCEIEEVSTHRAHGFPRPHQRYWRSVSFQVIDAYADENDLPSSSLFPSSLLFPSSSLFPSGPPALLPSPSLLPGPSVYPAS